MIVRIDLVYLLFIVQRRGFGDLRTSPAAGSLYEVLLIKLFGGAPGVMSSFEEKAL